MTPHEAASIVLALPQEVREAIAVMVENHEELPFYGSFYERGEGVSVTLDRLALAIRNGEPSND